MGIMHPSIDLYQQAHLARW